MGCPLLGLLSCAEQLAVAVASALGHVTGGIDHDIAGEKLVVVLVAVVDARLARVERHGVLKVVDLAGDLALDGVHAVDLGRESLVEDGVGDVRANVAHADDADLGDHAHVRSLREP